MTTWKELLLTEIAYGERQVEEVQQIPVFPRLPTDVLDGELIDTAPNAATTHQKSLYSEEGKGS